MHSPEPWRIKTDGRGYAESILDATDEYVVIQDITGPDVDSDMLRIVACVNFCRQFDTEFLANRQLVKVKSVDDIRNRSAADIAGFDGFVACTLVPVAKVTTDVFP